MANRHETFAETMDRFLTPPSLHDLFPPPFGPGPNDQEIPIGLPYDEYAHRLLERRFPMPSDQALPISEVASEHALLPGTLQEVQPAPPSAGEPA